MKFPLFQTSKLKFIISILGCQPTHDSSSSPSNFSFLKLLPMQILSARHLQKYETQIFLNHSGRNSKTQLFYLILHVPKSQYVFDRERALAVLYVCFLFICSSCSFFLIGVFAFSDWSFFLFLISIFFFFSGIFSFF